MMIGRADIELPDIFRLPGREGFRVHGLDIGIGEQAEHLQPLRRSHFFRELADRAGIEDVAAQGGAHFQMAFDEEQNGLAVGRVQIEPGQAVGRISTLAVTWLSVFAPLPVSCSSRAR